MSLAHWLAESWSWLAAGSTVILALGVVAVRLVRSPALAQRLAQLTIVSCLAWLVLAALPLPRPLAGGGDPGEEANFAGALPVTVHATPALPPLGVERPFAAPDITPTLAETAPPSAPRPWLALACLGVSLLQAVYLAIGWLRLRLRLRRATEPDETIQQMTREVAAAAGVRFTLHVDALGSAACTFGWRRPRVLVPRDLCLPSARGELLAVLRHEAVHVARHDALGQTIVAASRVVLWPHPLYWVLRGTARFAAELVADDQAARASDPCEYTRHLLRVAERSPRRGELLAPTICNRQSEFYRRMNMLLHRPHRLATRCSKAQRIASVTSALATLALAAGLWGTGPLPAQEPAVPDAPPRGTPRPAAEVESLAEVLARLSRVIDQLEGKTSQDTLGRLLPDRSDGPTPAQEPPPAGAPPGKLPRSATDKQDLVDVEETLRGLGHANEAYPRSRTAIEHQDPDPIFAKDVEVGPGDSLTVLLKRHGLPAADLERVLALNPDLAVGSLRVGQRIRLPIHQRAAPAVPDDTALPTTDAIRLATQLVDLHAEIRLADAEVARLEPLVAAGLAAQGEAVRAASRRDTARRKRVLLAKLARAEIAACQAELVVLQVKNAGASHGAKAEAEAQRLRLQARIDVLEAALAPPMADGEDRRSVSAPGTDTPSSADTPYPAPGRPAGSGVR